ncbi:MAG: divergent polysaccharide deacetylase family protein [Synergistaceae bacterium]|nr:divergent polysaccharide deacetylase family protein [Synergistaceae bacterium]
MIWIKYARYSMKRKQRPLYYWCAVFVIGALIGALLTSWLSSGGDPDGPPGQDAQVSGDVQPDRGGPAASRSQDLAVPSDAETSPDLPDSDAASDDAPASSDELALDAVSGIIGGDASGDVLDPRPMLALVLDDGGYSMALANRVISLDLPLTWAIIPGARYSRELALSLDREGIPYITHVPMQAFGDPDGRAGHRGRRDDYAIGVGMTDREIRDALLPLIDSLPGAFGISNHRGSKATSDAATMRAVMNVMKERDLFFLDSHTIAGTVGYSAAVASGVRAARNSFFIDHYEGRERIMAELERAMDVVAKTGSAVAICHMRLETVEFLENLAESDLSGARVRLVTLPQMMEERELRKGDM